MSRTSLTAGLWSYPLLAIGVSGVGLVVASLLLWFAVIGPANKTHRHQMHMALANTYADFFDVRLAALKREMNDAASASETVAALTSYDPATIAAQNAHLKQLISSALRVDIIPKGRAEVDLSAQTPISGALRTFSGHAVCGAGI